MKRYSSRISHFDFGLCWESYSCFVNYQAGFMYRLPPWYIPAAYKWIQNLTFLNVSSLGLCSWKIVVKGTVRGHET